TRNGRNGFFDAGLLVFNGSDNLVDENQFNSNNGDGIATRFSSTGNDIVNNQMLFNSLPPAHHDAADDSTTPANTWNDNNRCQTQTAPQPPPGVCNPGETPPPQ